jgi:hypothetical protein
VTLSLRRLNGTRRDRSHVAEMLATSAVIPPVSLFWRLYGQARYSRVGRPSLVDRLSGVRP